MGAAMIAKYPEHVAPFSVSIAFGMLRSRHHEELDGCTIGTIR